MHSLALQHVREEPGDDKLFLYPDYLIGCLLKEGVGKIEADLALQKDGIIEFVLTPAATATPRVVGRVGAGHFRSVLARFGARCNDEMLYGGHELFSCDFEREGRIRTHRFSVFVCNYQGTAFWLRLYLYGIDESHPIGMDAA